MLTTFGGVFALVYMKVETLKMQHNLSLWKSSARFVGLGFVLLFLSLSLGACSFSSDTEVQLPPYTPQIMVECYIEKGQMVRALVTETQSFLSPPSLPDVPDAQIIITDSQGKQYPFTYSPTRIGTKFFNYSMNDTLPWVEGAQYTLNLKRGERMLQGKTTILPRPDIQGLRTESNSQNLHQIFFHLGNNRADEWFRVLYNVGQLETPLTLAYLFADDLRTNPSNGLVEVQSPYRFKDGERVLIRVFSLNEDYYQFLESIELAKQSAGNPFAQPAQIISNIEGGIGIFTSLQADSVWVNLPK